MKISIGIGKVKIPKIRFKSESVRLGKLRLGPKDFWFEHIVTIISNFPIQLLKIKIRCYHPMGTSLNINLNGIHLILNSSQQKIWSSKC